MTTTFQVGFGSQGRAWAHSLRRAGKEVQILLRSPDAISWKAATQAGFSVLAWKDLPSALEGVSSDSTVLFSMLCPDSEIGPLYREYLRDLQRPLCLVLAHGFAVASGDLRVRTPLHEVALLAPKVIGSELEKACASFQGAPEKPLHRFKAAISFPVRDQARLTALAEALGFADDQRIEASFAQETTADLISEQGLLCGGLFPLVQWTMEQMQAAGVPRALIEAECLDELEFLARAIRERGPAGAFEKISQAAQAGTMAMQERFKAVGLQQVIADQAQEVRSGAFYDWYAQGKWKQARDTFLASLRRSSS